MSSFSKNFFSLSMLQVLNYLLPLIIIPYVIKHLGVENYGLLTFAQSISVFLMVFFDFGFNLIGVDKIAKTRLLSKRNELFNSIYLIKVVIFIVILLIYSIAIMSIDKLREDYLLYILFLFVSFFQSLFPAWFFQGIEKMKYILYFNFIGKFITLLIIIIFLKEKTDFNIYPLAFLIGFIVSDIIAFIFIFKKFKYKIYIPSFKRIVILFKKSFKIFSNSFLVKTYSNLNIIILGFFTSNLVVGYYSIGIKLSGVFSAFIGVFLQTIYPKFSKLSKENYCKYIKVFNKAFIGLFIVSSIVTVTYLFFEKEVLKLLVDTINQDLINIVLLSAFLIIFSPLGGLFTNFFIVSNEYNKFLKVAFWTAIVNFVVFAIFLQIDTLYSLAYTALITQIVHLLLNIYYYKVVKDIKCVE